MHIAWHPAFIEALKLELEEYIDLLEFHSEFLLSSEPLRIDCVIIKKANDLVIKKNFASVFREVNLFEYKSPDDYVSVTDFYKVYGYACLYSSFEKVPITSLTVSFVESHYPRELLTHLSEIRKFKVEETNRGIYNVTGDILPIQIIDSRQLSAEENLWLQGLNNNLDSNEIKRVLTEVYRQGKAARIQAYLFVITQANTYTVREAIKMSSETLTLDQVFEETGMAARWEEKKALAIAQNMVNLGLPLEIIVSATKLDPEKVKALFNN